MSTRVIRLRRGRTRSLSVLSFVLGAAGLMAEGSAWAQTVNLCDSGPRTARNGGWILDVTHDGRAAASTVNNLKQLALGVHHVGTAGDGLPLVTGVVHIDDGLSNTLMVGESHQVTLSCADADADGVVGLASLTFFLRDVSNGDLVPVSITPDDGELDERGEEAVTIVVGRVTVAATGRYWVFGTELPGGSRSARTR